MAPARRHQIEQGRIEVDAAAVYDCHHPSVAPPGLSVVLIHKCLRADRTVSGCELLRLGVARLSYLGRVDEREADSSANDIQGVSVDDVCHGLGETRGGPSAIRAARDLRVARGLRASRFRKVEC